jgi:hypothetical protein
MLKPASLITFSNAIHCRLVGLNCYKLNNILSYLRKSRTQVPNI